MGTYVTGDAGVPGGGIAGVSGIYLSSRVAALPALLAGRPWPGIRGVEGTRRRPREVEESPSSDMAMAQ